MMNLTPATNEQKRAILEGNLNQVFRLLLPKDQPLTLLFNLTLLWALAAICTVVIPVIVLAVLAIGLALFPIMFVRALLRPKTIRVVPVFQGNAERSDIQSKQVERQIRDIIKKELRK